MCTIAGYMSVDSRCSIICRIRSLSLSRQHSHTLAAACRPASSMRFRSRVAAGAATTHKSNSASLESMMSVTHLYSQANTVFKTNRITLLSIAAHRTQLNADGERITQHQILIARPHGADDVRLNYITHRSPMVPPTLANSTQMHTNRMNSASHCESACVKSTCSASKKR